MKKRFLLLITALLYATSLFGQVTISPMSLFLDSKQRFQTVIIMNTTDQAQEVSLKWQFGYPVTDETGNITMVYDDSKMEERYSAAEWIRGFPKRFVLQPGARQTIRVTVRAPRNLDDGTYWTRLVTSSNELSETVGEEVTEGIRTQINFQFNQITSVFYKHGEVSTGIELKEVRTSIEDNTLSLFADLMKSGNSPFLGSMEAKILNSKGEVVKEQFMFVSVYFDGLRRMKIDIEDLPSGSYTAEIQYVSKRKDIPDTDVISAPTVSAKTSFSKE